MANLAWAEALTEYSGKSGVTDADYQSYVEIFLIKAGVNISDYNIIASTSGITVTLKGNEEGTEYAGLTITKNTADVTFIPVDGAEITDERYANLKTGDIVQYGDYEYCYNGNYYYGYGSSPDKWSYSNSQNGWGVHIMDGCKQTIIWSVMLKYIWYAGN